MSVSSRSTKAQMYSEIERLRLEADRRMQGWRAAVAELAAEKAAHADTYAKLRAASQPRRAPDTSGRRAQLEALKAFSSKFRCTARLRNGVIELYSKKRGCWVAVPEGAQP
jgi:hypothetical protein